MLNLKSTTARRWLDQVDSHLDEILVDHAHCEKKAAGAAMNLLFAYGGQLELARAMADIVIEEMEHFRLVLDLLERRGVQFKPLKPSAYGGELHLLVRKGEPGRSVDRLLVAGLIEARSCERFALLRDHVADRELAAFYGSLFKSEARHHSTYVRVARLFATESAVEERLEELSLAEAAILDTGDPLPRMHS